MDLLDTLRSTGAVRGFVHTASNPAIPQDATAAASGGAASYVENGTNIYTLCRQM